jgi:protocatechuate 3,4-dioxygenase beta subunit
MAPILSLLNFGLLALPAALAHPGHDLTEEAVERAAFVKRGPNSVRSCASQLARRGVSKAALARRQEIAQKARVKRGLSSPLVRRDFAAYNTTHESTSGVSYGDDETLLFQDNSTCILQPEVTQGPYYVDGELIRSDITDGQEGVPLYLDIQIVDTSTCEPVPAVYMDLWHCNATGVYSGVAASGNGNSDDLTNLDATFLRGIVQTDSNGVAQYESIVPGHYTSRKPFPPLISFSHLANKPNSKGATHIHVLAHNANSTIIRTNSTLLESNATTHSSHVGQIFFDQALISLVEATAPYNTNTQEITLNSADQILSEEAEDMDPFVEWVQLGEDITDGIIAWISIGIDPTADSEVSSTATIYKSGGVANENSMGSMGGGDAPDGGNGTAPSGAMASGSAPPS